MTSPAGGQNQTGSQDLHPCSHRILRNGARLGRPCKVPRTRARNLGCISTTAFTCFINVVLWERAPYVASLMDGDELVRRSGQVTERPDQVSRCTGNCKKCR